MTLRKIGVFCVLALAGLGATSAMAKKVVSQTYEVVSWQANYEGQVAGKSVRVSLSRLGGVVTGSYCYEPCDPHRNGILLAGKPGGDLIETPIDAQRGQNRPIPSGRWKLQTLDGKPARHLSGRWSSMDGRRRGDVALALKLEPFSDEPEYEVRLVVDEPVNSVADCELGTSSLHVSQIRLYRQGRLQQSLKTDANGSCSLVQPNWVDANFDGQPDLSQALALPAGPNISYNTWLFDAAQRKMVLAPQELLEITSPVFDTKAKRIYSSWRASCCSHGLDIYTWKDGKPKPVEQAESYVLPVRKAGKVMGCYITPEYKDGHIVWPDALYRNADGLSLGGAPVTADNCDIDVASSMSTAQLQVLAPAQPGRKASVLSAYGMSYAEVNTPQGKRYCPDLAVFDVDARKIVRLTLSDNPQEQCLDSKPGQ